MYKQIIIVRKDLDMSHGKMAAQVSHASMAFLTQMIREYEVGEVMGENVYRFECFDIDKGIYEKWINGAFTKCVLGARNRNQLLKAKIIAEELGMIEGKDFFLIKDNCRTELEPEEFDENGIGKTLTCIGFIPMREETIDKIGKKYQLYK